MTKQIRITVDMAIEAKTRGLDSGECASETFFLVHGLRFSANDFRNSDMFEFWHDPMDDSFVIEFKGHS